MSVYGLMLLVSGPQVRARGFGNCMGQRLKSREGASYALSVPTFMMRTEGKEVVKGG